MNYLKVWMQSLRYSHTEKSNFDFNIQLFAGEKTEEPTSKRQSKAREEGQVAKSAEVNAVCLFLASAWILSVYGYSIYIELLRMMRFMFTEFSRQPFTIEAIHGLFIFLCMVFLKTAFPIMMVIALVMVIVNVAQVGFYFSTEALMPKFSKLNPINGLQKLFSPKVLVEILKSVVKVIITGYYVNKFINKELEFLPRLVVSDLYSNLAYFCAILLDLVFAVCKVMIFFALLDYGYQWWNHNQSLKMTKQEVKEEHKQMEGNPEIKSKIRQKQREMATMRMMQEVPKADVIVTNPTHFAVALKYENGMPAPSVIAKGQNLVAQRIKELAAEHKIITVENKPLARALFHTVEIGDIIPAELYQAVAEILAYVYKLKKKKA